MEKLRLHDMIEATLLSLGVSKVLQLISHSIFKKKDDERYHLFLEAIAILIAFMLILKFKF